MSMIFFASTWLMLMTVMNSLTFKIKGLLHKVTSFVPHVGTSKKRHYGTHIFPSMCAFSQVKSGLECPSNSPETEILIVFSCTKDMSARAVNKVRVQCPTENSC